MSLIVTVGITPKSREVAHFADKPGKFRPVLWSIIFVSVLKVKADISQHSGKNYSHSSIITIG